jgi:hypothetical protein
MSDIKDLITVTGSNEVAPEAPVAEVKTETSLTAEDVGNTEGLAVGTPDPIIKEDEAKSTEEEVAPETPEIKSKEERREDGSKVGRKIGKLNKEKAKEARRADKAEAELNELKKRYADFEKAKGEQDLDSMSFDDRVAKVAEQRYEESAMKREAKELQAEIGKVHDDNWKADVQAFQESHPDYDKSVNGLENKIPREIAESIRGMGRKGVEVAYNLSKDEDAIRQLSTASPMNSAMILFGLQQQGSPVVQPSVETPQEPVKAPVQATPSTSLTPQQQNKPRVKHPSQLGMNDFIKHRLEVGTLRR